MAKLTAAEREMYARFTEEFPRCWGCGWEPFRGDYRAWMIPRLERAHIIGGSGRRADRRSINMLCAGCHRLSHGDRIKVDGEYLPNLSLANMLWLKLQNDAENYDRDFLISLSIKNWLPDEERPHKWFGGMK